MDGGAGDDLPEFLAEDAGEPPLKRCRAPCDERAYDSDGEEGPCFASQYQADTEDAADSLGGTELRHAFKEMHALIARYHASNTSNRDLVDAVHTFYERRIRAAYDYGPWSKKSIWKYITQYSEAAPERQATEAIKTIYAQIEFLRNNVAMRNEVTGEVTPDLRTVRELATLCKMHASLIAEQKKRVAK